MLQSPNPFNRELSVFTPLGDDLVLQRFEGTESMSELFEFDLEMLSPKSNLKPNQIVGRNVTFTLRDKMGGQRCFNGYVNHFAYQGQTDLATTYRAKVVPWLWFLTQTTDCRIFQEKTTAQIIETIFGDLGFSDFRFELTGDYEPREYCVQYREKRCSRTASLRRSAGHRAAVPAFRDSRFL